MIKAKYLPRAFRHSLDRPVGACITTLLMSSLLVCHAIAGQPTDIGAQGWKLWLDRQADWQHDQLFIPPVDVAKLPVHAPTCGWDQLFTQSLPATPQSASRALSDATQSLDVQVPGTVEEYFWDALKQIKPRSNGRWPYGWWLKGGPVAGGGANALAGDYQGVSWWGREFTVPANARGKRIKLFFSEGVRLRAEVFVNRKLVGYDLIEQMPFEVDITDAVQYGESNQLAIRITDPNGNFGWGDTNPEPWGNYLVPESHGFGGILGPVMLDVVEPVHVTDIFVENKPSITDVNLDVTLINEGPQPAAGTMDVEITEACRDGEPVASPACVWRGSVSDMAAAPGQSRTITLSASVPQARLWAIRHGNLYDAVVTLKDPQGRVLDRKRQRFGFRWFGPQGYGVDSHYCLNGQRIFLLSAISWGFWPQNGIFPTRQLARRHILDALTLGQNMLNFHRCAGNTQVLNLADELGILYYEESGGYHSGFFSLDKKKSPEGYDFPMAYARAKQLRLVLRDRDHPSLVQYNMINEPIIYPDSHVKRDMADAHRLDPTRLISFASGFMDIGKDQPKKLHMLPYDQTQRTVGYCDIHHAADSQGVYMDDFYNSPTDFRWNLHDKPEIFVLGEEGAIASPPQLEMIHNERNAAALPGWDGSDYEDWYQAYARYLHDKGLGKYFPSITALITSMGNVMYYEHGRLVENTRIRDEVDLMVLNGFEDMKIEDLSGMVDCYRHFKGDPNLIAQYMRPALVAVKAHDKIGQVNDINLVDLFIINQHAIPTGDYRLTATVLSPDGKTRALYDANTHVSGGDRFSDLAAQALPVRLDRGPGYYRLAARLQDAAGQTLADGHEEIFAVDWKSDVIGGQGAIIHGSPELIQFLANVKKAHVVPYADNLGRLDYILLDQCDQSKAPNTKPLKAKHPRAKPSFDLAPLLRRVSTDGTVLFLLSDADQWAAQLRQLHAFPNFKIFQHDKHWMGGDYFVRAHPFFRDLPVNGAMNWEYQSLVRYDEPSHFGFYAMKGEEPVVSDVGAAAHLVATAVGILPYGKGKIVFSTLDLTTDLLSPKKASAVPKKILCNYLQWAAGRGANETATKD